MIPLSQQVLILLNACILDYSLFVRRTKTQGEEMKSILTVVQG